MITYRNRIEAEIEFNIFVYVNRLSDYFFVLVRPLSMNDK